MYRQEANEVGMGGYRSNINEDRYVDSGLRRAVTALVS